jgi:flagellar hook-associated protein 2
MTTALSSTSSTSSTSSSTNPFGPALQSLGIGSGLDVNAIISGLMAINQQPMTLLQQAAANYQTHLSTLGQFRA